MWIVLFVAALAGLPVEEVRWEITVRGPVAEAWVTHRITNTGHSESVTGQFVMPLPYDGAVDAMRLVMGDTVVEGDIKERQAAREAYDTAAQQGTFAGLTAQEPGGEYTQDIANIPPQQTVQVHVRVRWPVRRIDDGYELVLPTRVMPRFDMPTVTSLSTEPPRVTVSIDAEAGFAIHHANSPTHPELAFHSAGSALRLPATSVSPGRDVVLHWSSQFDSLQAAALGPDEHTVLVIEGPKVAASRQTAMEWLIVLDTSGSMSGVPWLQARAIVREILDGMHSRDAVGLVTFGNNIHALAPQGGPAGQQAVWQMVEASGPNGGTYLHHAVQQALDHKTDAGKRRVLVLISDGLVEQDTLTLRALAEAQDEADVAMVMVGDAPNAALVERMATAAGGFVTRALPNEHGEPGLRVLGAMQNATCSDLQIRWRGQVEQTSHVPRTVFAGRPVVVVAEHAQAPLAAEVSCRVGGQRWSATALRRHALDDGAVRSLFGRARLEQVLHEGWALDEDRQARGTAIALQYGLISPWTSLVAIDRSTPRPDPIAARDAIDMQGSPAQVDVTDTSRGQVLTRDFLNSIPAGRSHQSAIGIAPGVVGVGGNPNMAGGQFNENAYMLDGVNITDPVTGTLSLNVKYEPLRPNHTELVAPYELKPVMPTGSNTTAVRASLGAGTTQRSAAGITASGPVVRDRLWLAARTDHGAWKGARQTDVGLRLFWMPNAEVWSSGSVHRHRLTVADGIGRWDQAVGRLSWALSNKTTLHADAMFDERTTALTQRTLALGQLRGVIQLRNLTLSTDATAGALTGHHSAPHGVGQAHARAVAELGEHSVAHAQVGTTRLDRAVVTGIVGAKLHLRPRAEVTLSAERSVPPLSHVPAAATQAPVSHTLAATLAHEPIQDLRAQIHGELSDAQMWGASSDVFAAEHGAPLLSDAGGAVEARLTKMDANRWHADLSYLYQHRTPGASSHLSQPGLEHMVQWTDRLRRHNVTATASWRLPTDPWSQALTAQVRWISAVPDLTAAWADARLQWGVGYAVDIDVRQGTVQLAIRAERGANTPVALTDQPTASTVPWTRLDASATEQTRCFVGVQWLR